MYYFKMEDNVFRSQYWADVKFEIFNELDSEIYYGDAFTSIGFEWDSDKLQFTYVPSKEDRLVDNSHCSSCNNHQPKPKPKPRPGTTTRRLDSEDIFPNGDEDIRQGGEGSYDLSMPRVLKGSKTSHPTISPAPTLNTAVVLDPLRVQMTTTTFNGWHGIGLKNGTGTWWHIYDSFGKRLIYSGTLCGLGPIGLTWRGDCDVSEIPDGKYVFRVGGAIDEFKGDHTWSFCGIDGGATQMFSFEVKNRQCIPYNSYTASDYCLRRLGMTLVTSGVIELYGVAHELREADFEGLKVAVTHLFAPAHVKRVDVALTSDGDNAGGVGIMVKFKAHVDIFSLGFEVSDENDMGEVFEVLYEQLQASTMTGQLVNEIVAAAEEVYGDHMLMNIRGAKLLFVTNEGLELFSNPLADMSTDTSVESVVNVKDEDVVTQSWSLVVLDVSTEGGYVLLGVLGMLLAGVVWRISIRTDIRVRRPYRGLSPAVKSPSKLEEGGSGGDEKVALLPTPTTDGVIKDFGHMLSDLQHMTEDEGEESADELMSRSVVSGSESDRIEASRRVISNLAGMLSDLKKLAEIEDEALRPFRRNDSSS